MAEKTLQRFLNEAKGRTVLFTFGRFQPPTKGHEMLINTIITKAKKDYDGADVKIFTSPSNDPKKNPLTFEQKIRYLRLAFSKSKEIFSTDPSIRSPFMAAEMLAKKYDTLVLVVGSDRVPEFQRNMTSFVEKHGAKLEVISAGSRDPDSDDYITAISGTKMRTAVKDDDFKTFYRGSLSGLSEPFAKQMFKDVAKGLKEETESQKLEIEEAILHIKGKGLARDDMPQIPGVAEFISYLQDSLGVPVIFETMPVGAIRFTQNQLNQSKVAEIIKYLWTSSENPTKEKPLILSKDYYLLDGQHTYAAILMSAKYSTVETYRVDMCIDDLIEAAFDFGAFRKTIHEHSSNEN